MASASEQRLIKAVAELLGLVAEGQLDGESAAECIENALKGRSTTLSTQKSLLDKRLDAIEGIPSLVVCGLYDKIPAGSTPQVRDLVRLSERELLRFRNVGRVSVGKVKDTLNELGLSLGMDLPD